jgi:hypothetical protein
VKQIGSFSKKTFDNYAPFGMGMVSRSWTAPGENYRFGFNGAEKDDEVKGNGNSYEFTFRHQKQERQDQFQLMTNRFYRMEMLLQST